jgi:O-antigen/teichoic acid export membrane protein
MPVRVALTGMDQGLSSASNFAVGVAVARVAGIASLGAYSLAYAVWLGVAAMHRALITDPMAIENDLRSADARHHIRVGLAAEITFGFGMFVVFATSGLILLASGQHQFGVALLAVSPWLPALLAQDYWRWAGFMRGQPGHSLANDAFFDVVQAASFVILLNIGVRSSLLGIVSWGIGATGGALFGLWQFWVRPTVRGGFTRLRHRWSVGKWLLGGTASGWGAAQMTTVLTGVILGPVGIGGLKAAQSLVIGPAQVLIQAGGSVGLPEASKSLRERGWPGLRKVQRVVTVAGIASVGSVALVVILFGRRLLNDIYGPGFGRYAVVADILALSALLSSFGLGAILSLKATRKLRLLFRVQFIALIVAVISVSVLAPIFGIEGAAAAAGVTSAAGVIGTLIVHFRHSRIEAEKMFATLQSNAVRAAPRPEEVHSRTAEVDGPEGPPTTDSPVPTTEPSLTASMADQQPEPWPVVL